MICPAREILIRLLDDRIDPGERDRLEGHLENCSLCQERIERIAGELDPSLVLMIRDILSERIPSTYFSHISPAFSANYSLAFDEAISRREASRFSGISNDSGRNLLDTRISYFEMARSSRRIPRKNRGISLDFSATSP